MFLVTRSSRITIYEHQIYHFHRNKDNIFILNYSTGEILLHTFYERQGKKRTEYQSHIPEALSRLTEYIQKR